MRKILIATLGILLAFPTFAEVWQARYGVAETYNFKLYNADGTLDIDEVDSGTEVSLSCNEGAETAATNDFVDEGTFYSIALTAAEMQCERIAVVVAATTTEVFFIQTIDNASAMTPMIVQTGDSFVRLGAPAGASVSADLVTIDNFVDDLETRLGTPSDLGTGTTFAANLVDIEGQTDDIGVAGAGLTAADDAVMTRLGAPAGASVSADIAAIEAQTDDIGAAGAGLTAVVWNPAWDAEVESENTDALVAIHLDHLLAADYDPAAKPGVAGSWINELSENEAGAIRYTSQALELAPTAGGGNMTQIEGVDATDAIDARIAAANILRPTTAGRTLDVTTGGNAGIDFDNIVLTNAAPAIGLGASGTANGTHSTTTLDLGTNAPAASTDVVGRTLDVFTSAGAPKFSATITSYNSTDGVASFAAVTTAPVNGDLWYLWDTAVGSGATDVNILTVESTDATTYFESLDNPTLAILGTPVDLGVGGATLADNLQEIESQTDDIGAAGAGLTAAGITAAGVRSAVGLATANTDAQFAATQAFIDTEVATAVSQTTPTAIRSAIGLAAANADAQFAGIESGVDVDTIEGVDATDAVDARLLASLANQRILVGTCDTGSTTQCTDDARTEAATSQLDDRVICFSDAWCALVTDFNTATDTVVTTKVAPTTRSGLGYTIFPATAQ